MTVSVGVPDCGAHWRVDEAEVADGRASAHAVAHAVAVLDDLGAALEEAAEWLGAPLATYVSGAGGPTELAGWVEAGVADTPGREALARLQTAAEVVEIFGSAGQPTAARAWLREPSPGTVGRSPAQLLRHARHERLLHQIRDAAHRHVEDLHY